MKRVLLITAMLAGFATAADAGVSVIPLAAPMKAAGASKDSTLTMLIESEGPAKYSILFIPGGDGTTPIKEGMTETRHPMSAGIFIPLANAGYNVVIVSNPTPIDPKNGRPGADRLDRIETVVKFYREKFNVPVILFGHSNGTAAVHELANRSEENRQLIGGAIISGAREEFGFKTEVSFPVIIVHHKLDACDTTLYRSAVSRYELYKSMKMNVTLETIEGGEGGGNPCYAGYHMYDKAYEKVADALLRNLPR